MSETQMKEPEMDEPKRCPTCDSPWRNCHPAVQWEGEVQLCRDQWHQPTADEIEKREGMTTGA